MDMTKDKTIRCGHCPNCKRVEDCRRLAFRALSDPRNRIPTRMPIGEDVRLIWNQALRDYPCTGGKA